MQRNWKRNLAATHYDVTAALPHAFEAVFAQEIAQLRAGKDAQLPSLLSALNGKAPGCHAALSTKGSKNP